MLLFRISFILCPLLCGTAACEGSTNAAPGSPPGAQPPAPVVTAIVEDTKLRVERSYLGEVTPSSDARLSAAESARVRKVLVREGDTVKAGDLLVELDDRLAQAELREVVASRDQAEVESEHAKREAERYNLLESEAIVSGLEATRERDEAERLQAREKGVKAAVKVRGERLYRHRIVAPFDGMVASRLADPGDWLTAGQAAIQLVSAGRMEVLVRVPEDLLDQLHGLDTVALVSDGRRTEGTLLGVVDALDPETRTALLRIEPKEPPTWLRSGKSLDVVFTVERDGGWVVPRDALVYGVGSARVIRVVGGKAVPVNVEELAVSDEHVLVKGELEKGAVIVTRGNERLRPGQEVTTDKAFGASSATSAPPGSGSQPSPGGSVPTAASSGTRP